MELEKILEKLNEKFPSGFKLHFFQVKGEREMSFSIDLFLNDEWNEKVYTGYVSHLIWQCNK